MRLRIAFNQRHRQKGRERARTQAGRQHALEKSGRLPDGMIVALATDWENALAGNTRAKASDRFLNFQISGHFNRFNASTLQPLTFLEMS